MLDLTTMLEDAQTIAVVGCSPRPSRTSHAIARYLQQAGYEVIPVNPHHDELLGTRCYASVRDIPGEPPIDIVNVFRRPEYTAEMVEDAAAWSQEHDFRPAIWTQLGVSSREAKQRADEADLPYVENRCIMVEHRGRVM